MFQALEEATGISLDFISVSTETAADDFMLRCATNDLPDMIQNGDTQYTGGGAKAIEDEILLDLYAQLGLTLQIRNLHPLEHMLAGHTKIPLQMQSLEGEIFIITRLAAVLLWFHYFSPIYSAAKFPAIKPEAMAQGISPNFPPESSFRNSPRQLSPTA